MGYLERMEHIAAGEDIEADAGRFGFPGEPDGLGSGLL